MSKILYNNLLLGISGQPDPLVAITSSPIFSQNGKRIAVTEGYQLQGQITGNSTDSITGHMAYITNVFSKDFGTLELKDDDGFNRQISGCKVTSLRYEVGSAWGIQNYTVDLTCYPSRFFDSLGIVEKRNEWNISQDDEQNFTIKHEVYAKGANTAPSWDNALENAKTFVAQFTGFNPPSLFPYFISGFSGSLDTLKETVNRLDGTILVTETYLGSSGSALQKQVSCVLESGADGVITASVEGSLKIGKGESFDRVRQAFSGIDLFNYATGSYVNYRGVTGLNSVPLSSGIQENVQEGVLVFRSSFNDWPTVSYKHDYDVISTSGLNGTITTTVNGRVQGLGRQFERYDNAYKFFKGLDAYSLAMEGYVGYVGIGYPYTLNKYPLTSGLSIDRFEGSIQYNMLFNDRAFPINGDGLKDFKVSIEKQHAMRRVSAISIPDSEQGIDALDLLYDARATISVRGEVLVAKPWTYADATGYAGNYINMTFMSSVLAANGKTKVKLEEALISKLVDKQGCSFAAVYSFDEPTPTTPNSSYTLITSLNL